MTALGMPAVQDVALICPTSMRTLPDCDCPFEHWHVGHGGVCLDVHLEEDGTTHAILDAGDWQEEVTGRGHSSIEEAREWALQWASEWEV